MKKTIILLGSLFLLSCAACSSTPPVKPAQGTPVTGVSLVLTAPSAGKSVAKSLALMDLGYFAWTPWSKQAAQTVTKREGDFTAAQINLLWDADLGKHHLYVFDIKAVQTDAPQASGKPSTASYKLTLDDLANENAVGRTWLRAWEDHTRALPTATQGWLRASTFKDNGDGTYQLSFEFLD